MSAIGRREFIAGGTAAIGALAAVGAPVRSMLGARGAVGVGGIPPDITIISSLLITAKGSASYLDTGVPVPASGDMLIECDYVSKTLFKDYVVVGGANGTNLTGQGFSLRGHTGYYNKTAYYYTAIWNRRIINEWVQYPARISGGIVGEEEYFNVNGTVMTGPLDGTERGTSGGHTFTFGRAANPDDDFSGTVLGAARIRLAGIIVWDGLPAVRRSDGAVGYYDIVSKSFFPANQNFTAGPEI